MNTKPKLVFSTTLEHAGWSNTTIVPGEAVEKIGGVKSAPGGELLVLGSAHLTAHFAAAGVLDELRTMVCPIVIGQGHSLFEDLKDRLALRMAHVRQFDSGNVLLTCRPLPRSLCSTMVVDSVIPAEA
jgi:dihydrofolate reductase